MSDQYDPKSIENKWQKAWDTEGVYRVSNDTDKEKMYVLDMFPYPSGEGLHVGHPRGYIATDVYSRFKRMHGYNVLHPMGWDAFGLPAENFAIKHKVHPREAVDRNVARFKEQLSIIGPDYDWNHEINTTDPEFYKWTQWMFLKMYEKGLAYESHEPINWCPGCQTGLANEDLEADGTCERCDSVVEKKPMRQWVLKITDYADRLLEDLDTLPKWPEGVKEAQRNWIGKSEGSEINFKLKTQSEKPKVLIIHGFEGDPSEGWKPWLKNSLEDLGYEVRSPKMPNFAHPDYSEVMDFLEEQTKDFTENDIVVGHSLGGHFAIKIAEKKKIGKIVLVAPTIGGFEMSYEIWKKNDPGSDFDSCEKILEGNKVEFDKIKARQKIAIFGETDRGIPVAHADLLDDSWQVVKKPNTGHMSIEKEVPEILKAIVPNIDIFTTRADTLFGATYVVLAPEHALVAKLPVQNRDDVDAYVAEVAQKSEIDRTAEGKEKTGVKLEGVTAINPANNEELPVYIADYVLAHYGTGAVMAVPAHDERDFEFATKFDLPIKKVIDNGDSELPSVQLGTLVSSGDFDGLTSVEAKKKITEFVNGEMKSTYRLNDWVFSRQRYWGEPIPMVFDADGKVYPVDVSELPVMLPNVESYEPTGTGESPLASIDEWVNVRGRITDAGTFIQDENGDMFKRETNTMPQWAGSSWYYLRYVDPKNVDIAIDGDKEKHWLPVDVYVGGDHATRHLIYARFWHKFLYDINVVSDLEPFPRLEFLGFILAEDGRKMSKRWGNIVNPDDMVNRFGADAFRLYEMFIGPFENTVPWSTDGLVGTRRFVEKVWRQREKLSDNPNVGLDASLHKAIQKVSNDIENFKFNTAVSQMMILVNEIDKADSIGVGQYKILLQLLAPFMPHATEELWREFGEKESIHISVWPEFDASKIVEDEISIVVQVNGKVRAILTVAADISEDEIKTLALADSNVQKYVTEEPKKVIYVKGKLVSLVV